MWMGKCPWLRAFSFSCFNMWSQVSNVMYPFRSSKFISAAHVTTCVHLHVNKRQTRVAFLLLPPHGRLQNQLHKWRFARDFLHDPHGCFTPGFGASFATGGWINPKGASVGMVMTWQQCLKCEPFAMWWFTMENPFGWILYRMLLAISMKPGILIKESLAEKWVCSLCKWCQLYCYMTPPNRPRCRYERVGKRYNEGHGGLRDFVNIYLCQKLSYGAKPLRQDVLNLWKELKHEESELQVRGWFGDTGTRGVGCREQNATAKFSDKICKDTRPGPDSKEPGSVARFGELKEGAK